MLQFETLIFLVLFLARSKKLGAREPNNRGRVTRDFSSMPLSQSITGEAELATPTYPKFPLISVTALVKPSYELILE